MARTHRKAAIAGIDWFWHASLRVVAAARQRSDPIRGRNDAAAAARAGDIASIPRPPMLVTPDAARQAHTPRLR